MPHEYIDWYNIKDPHPMALSNLQRIVDFMMQQKAIDHASPVSIYAVAKYLGKQHKQATQLLRGRPGFVEVHRDGKFQGYYYDYTNFGPKYPSTYRDLKRTKILLSEDINEVLKINAKELTARMPEMAKQLRAEIDKPAMPDIVLPEVPGREQVTLSISFPLSKGDTSAVLDDLKGAAFMFGGARDNNGLMPLTLRTLSLIYLDWQGRKKNG